MKRPIKEECELGGLSVTLWTRQRAHLSNRVDCHVLPVRSLSDACNRHVLLRFLLLQCRSPVDGAAAWFVDWQWHFTGIIFGGAQHIDALHAVGLIGLRCHGFGANFLPQRPHVYLARTVQRRPPKYRSGTSLSICCLRPQWLGVAFRLFVNRAKKKIADAAKAIESLRPEPFLRLLITQQLKPFVYRLATKMTCPWCPTEWLW